MNFSITRRAFVARITVLTLASASAARASTRRRADALRIGVFGVDATPSNRRSDQRSMGLALGVDEATHAARLFGGSIEIVTLPAARTRLSAIIGGDPSRCSRSEVHDVPYLNVACSADDLRRQCGANLFHVVPSESMCRDAKAQRDGEVVAWHASLTRFGADTLNQRFLKRFEQPMTSDAWAAWLAVKMLWEASLRARSTEAAALGEYLARDTTQFDGHKGRPLSFRAWDHQLRQPLYIISGERLAEVPAPTPAGSSARASLDALGGPPIGAPCTS